MRRYWMDRRVRIAALTCVGAIVLTAWTLQRAVRPLALPRSDAVPTTPVIPTVTVRAVHPLGVALAATAADPFRPDRTRPPERFRLPGERLIVATEADRPANMARELSLIGTVVLPGGGGVAMSRVGGDAPRLVRVGDRIGGYTLRSVHQGRAVFVTERGEEREIHVPKPGT
jgi:hypothetical protein